MNGLLRGTLNSLPNAEFPCKSCAPNVTLCAHAAAEEEGQCGAILESRMHVDSLPLDACCGRSAQIMARGCAGAWATAPAGLPSMRLGPPNSPGQHGEMTGQPRCEGSTSLEGWPVSGTNKRQQSSTTAAARAGPLSAIAARWVGRRCCQRPRCSEC